MQEPFVGFTLAAFAIRELIGGETARVTVRARLVRRLLEILGGAGVVFVFVAVKSGQRFVELRAVRIVPDPALQEVAAEIEIFALRFDPQGEARLRRDRSKPRRWRSRPCARPPCPRRGLRAAGES